MSMSDAKAAIGKVFGDTSVSTATTRDRLEELREYIDEYLATLAEVEAVAGEDEE